MSFPDHRIANVADYSSAYFDRLNKAATAIDGEKLQQAADLLASSYGNGASVYSCGNGGSAAIANHLVCDHCKLVRSDTNLHSRVITLSSTIEIITAIGNDISFDEIFSFQLKTLAKPGDILVTISSSGNSPNIVHAVEWAKDNGLKVIALTGFSGGESAHIADINLHVNEENYGIIEDLHQAIMHILAQYIRETHMPPQLIPQRKF